MGYFRKPRGFGHNLKIAFRGIVYNWKTQGHFRFHLLAGTAAVLCAWWARLSRWEWLVLILTIGAVLAAEVMNTAVELVVDLIEPNFHPLAGIAKDVAAGVVLITSLQAVAVGLFLFLPAFSQWFRHGF